LPDLFKKYFVCKLQPFATDNIKDIDKLALPGSDGTDRLLQLHPLELGRMEKHQVNIRKGGKFPATITE
jgi:hypothetical protein